RAHGLLYVATVTRCVACALLCRWLNTVAIPSQRHDGSFDNPRSTYSSIHSTDAILS
ncbi:hypothetical protein BaRGS_00017853, partial [Batillaria attramentaria]